MSTTTVLLTTLCAADNIQLSSEISLTNNNDTKEDPMAESPFVMLCALPGASSRASDCTAVSVFLHRHMSGGPGGGEKGG